MKRYWHAIGLALVALGIALWIFGSQYGFGFFIVGVLIELSGYIVGGLGDKKKE